MSRLRLCAALLLAALTASMAMADTDVLQRQVADTERAFAATMADRDFVAFQTFLADETIFFAGERPLRGRAAVAAVWARLYEGEAAPFSWEPRTVEVLDSGTLAISSGPVFDAAGAQVGVFNSIWRQESPGVWRIVFDKGSDYCPEPAADE